MARALTVTLELDIADGATAEEVVRLLGAICAQVEDDEDGIVLASSMDAPHPAWQAVDQ